MSTLEAMKHIKQCLQDKMYAHAEMYLNEAIARAEHLEAEKQEQCEHTGTWTRASSDGTPQEVICGECGKSSPPYVPTERQRQPLTDEEAMDAYCETPPFGTYKEAFIAGIRFIEAAYGIKEQV